MRIGVLTSYFYFETEEVQGKDRIIYGGAEHYLLRLCKLLQSMNIEVAVYQPLNNVVKEKNGKAYKVNSGQIAKNFKGIPIICLPLEDNTWRYSTNPGLNMVFNEIAGFYDLVIYFVTFLAFPAVVYPCITISHGIFWDYNQHSLRNWNENERKEFFRRQLYGFTAPDVCVAVDSNVRKVISALDPGSEQRIHVIPNFVDTEQFKPVKKTWDGMRVLYPRRLTQLRGCNDFIRATKEYPDYDYIAVGQSGDEELEKKVIAWGKTTPNLQFMYKPMDEMPEVYQQADISVIPTRAAEGLSLSLLESMACGLPVITTPVGGLGDAVIDGYNALVYDPNHENLGDYIDLLAKDEDMRRKFGERNRQIAVECFDLKKWQAQWIEIIKRFS